MHLPCKLGRSVKAADLQKVYLEQFKVLRNHETPGRQHLQKLWLPLHFLPPVSAGTLQSGPQAQSLPAAAVQQLAAQKSQASPGARKHTCEDSHNALLGARLAD